MTRPDPQPKSRPSTGQQKNLLFQKVAIFVDAENIEMSSLKHHEGRTDYKKILDRVGDWADGLKCPPRPGGWAFQYNNAHYPDLDDTAVVVMALDRARRAEPNPALVQLSLKGLSSSVQGFEGSHPRLVQLVNSLCTTLSNLGI